MKTAPLCFYASTLKDKLYSIHRRNGQKSLHWKLLWNDENSGYMQHLQKTENKIFNLFLPHINEWEKNGLNTEEIKDLYQQITPVIEAGYKDM